MKIFLPRTLLGLVCLLILSAGEAIAEHDGNIWTMTNISTQLDDRFTANLELHYRWYDNGTDFGQRLIRPNLTYRLNDRFTLTAGYVHVLTEPIGGVAFSENRPWQQIGYNIYKNDYGLSITGRSRLEQRFIENRDDVGWRLRQFLRFDVPFQDEGQWKAVLWNETFVGLNTTSWGQRSDIDQVRNFVGVGVPISKNLNLEAGYLNQWINRPGEDLINHAFSTYFNFKF